MLRRYLQKLSAKFFYPTTAGDWYLSKGYTGGNEQERFAEFFKAQKQEGSIFYEEFKSIYKGRRQFIKSGKDSLDSVLLVPNLPSAIRKIKEELYFVFFQGRGEFYEGRFRDMAIQAGKTGASVLGFNHKGFKSSTGSTTKISDMVEDGIAIVRYLIDVDNLLPNQIILQGNSLGAAVQEAVGKYFDKTYGFKFRQINSNSFSSLAAVLAFQYRISFLERIIRSVLLYVDWEITPGEDFYQTGLYRCHFYRNKDRTLLRGALYHSKIDIEKDSLLCHKQYQEAHKQLYSNSKLCCDNNNKDPHSLSLNQSYLIDAKSGKRRSVYEYINFYIQESKKYI